MKPSSRVSVIFSRLVFRGQRKNSDEGPAFSNSFVLKTANRPQFRATLHFHGTPTCHSPAALVASLRGQEERHGRHVSQIRAKDGDCECSRLTRSRAPQMRELRLGSHR